MTEGGANKTTTICSTRYNKNVIITYHLIPQRVIEGDTCINTDVILSTECGTIEFFHSTTAASSGPLLNPNIDGKRYPLYK